ncbi:cyclic pyranopterin monophosphate synthase MoaC [Natroniella sulfidigena]|uniref:cyclic pyranopterin monophosphate synthase MoaC n=1 Tax=Natroniella sulfidigena TaxID=723921 RepID=UPI0024A70101|nr:cyclic pyranopterin monophosphate synthase MoaC [Natroniella sulfidigena]
MGEFSHFDEEGRSRMVDVTDKKETKRIAIAQGKVKVSPKTLELIKDQEIEKGDVLEVARVAGIMGVKRTPDLIPMCHPLLIGGVDLKFNIIEPTATIEILATTKITGKTGVEMEALTAVSVAGLTIYDMCKAVDKGIEIGEIKLLKKTGGKSGIYLDQELIGEAIAFCSSPEKGTAKEEIAEATFKEDYGLEGDAHAGDWHRQVSLLAIEDIDFMREQGLDLELGAFGENVITKGLKLPELPVGRRLKLGKEIILEVTQIGKECHDRCNIYHQVGDCIMPRRGIFAKVIKGGTVKPGTKLEVLIND